jgi:membrane protease YdiL (CAAX protease family)
LFSFITDLYTHWKPINESFRIKNPTKETFYFVLCFVLGTIFLIVRFTGIVDWQNLKPLLKLIFVPLIIFTFPIALAIIMLLLKYKPKDLGLRPKGLFVIIPIVLISATINRFILPNNLSWNSLMTEFGGVLNMLFLGFIVAALSEEFFRVIGQTRMGAMFKNNGMGWFITTVIWALMHAPKWYGEDKDITEAILSSIRIIPIGLMWGYVTHRTKSILPSVFIHGLNVWGLQNF